MDNFVPTEDEKCVIMGTVSIAEFNIKLVE